MKLEGIASLAKRCRWAGCKKRVLTAMTEDGRTVYLDAAVPVYLVFRSDNGAMHAERAHDCYPVHVDTPTAKKEKTTMKIALVLLLLVVTSAFASPVAIVEPWPDPTSYPCYVVWRPEGPQGHREAMSCVSSQHCSLWAFETCLGVGQPWSAFQEYNPITMRPEVCLITCRESSVFGITSRVSR